jgi:hypothetical protein
VKTRSTIDRPTAVLELYFDTPRRLPLPRRAGPNRRNRLVALNMAVGVAPTMGGFESGSKTRIGISAYKRGEGSVLLSIHGFPAGTR